MENINDSYFFGKYKDIWKAMIPEILTERELAFMIPYFKLNSQSRVLDLMCGYGRHAIGLGRQGISVVAVDNLPDYITEIETEVQKENLPVTPVCSAILPFQPEPFFDLAICMGNSLNFFNRRDTITLLQKISSVLKPEGNLLINTWSIAEIAWKSFSPEAESQVGDYIYKGSSKSFFMPARIETETSIVSPDGSKENRLAVDYIYSLNEMEEMLLESGLFLKVVYSIPGKKKFTAGEPRAYLIAGKQ